MVKDKDMQFFMENLKMKSNKDKQIFSNCPANDLFFSWKVRNVRSNQNKLLKEIGLY